LSVECVPRSVRYLPLNEFAICPAGRRTKQAGRLCYPSTIRVNSSPFVVEKTAMRLTQRRDRLRSPRADPDDPVFGSSNYCRK